MNADTSFVGSGYFENTRPDLARLVPSSAMSILDVGCGAGRLGELLKNADARRRVYGIEYHQEAAAAASKILDRVFTEDVQHMPPPLPSGSLDCMIFADVLEHLVDPLSVLRRFLPMLKPSGIVLCSIPNIRHYTAILRLVTRGWVYEDFGLFDRTHLRFYSRRSMHALLLDAGLRDVTSYPRIVASRKARLVNALAGGLLEEFLAVQYYLTGHSPANV